MNYRDPRWKIRRMGWPGGGAVASTPWYLAGGIAASSCLAAFKAIGAASLAASYTNLANPGTYDLTTSAAPTFSAATGWGMTGARLDCALTGNSDYLSIAIRLTNANDAVVVSTGAGINNYFHLYPRYSDGKAYFRWYNDSGDDVHGVSPDGVWVAVPGGGYANGVACPAYTPTPEPRASFWLGNVTFTGEIQAVAVYKAILTADQAAALTTAMAALA